MKVEETVFERNIRLIFETLCVLFQDPNNQESAQAIQQHLKSTIEKYHRNMLIDLLKKKLFDIGVYHHQQFSIKLFLLKKRSVEKLIDIFENGGVAGIISSLVDRLYIKLNEADVGELVRTIVQLMNTTIYDGNHQAKALEKIRKEISLEIYENDQLVDDDNQLVELVEFKKVVQEKKLSKDVIIFDETYKVICWPKESFESLVQLVKIHQKVDDPSLDILVELIGKVREIQTNQIIDINSVGQSDLAEIPLHLRNKFEKLKQENESVRTLISQGFNTNSFHFILEFIQNADDSDYSTSGDGILEFDFDSDSKMLKIKSNESGFTYDNLYALSGIANSDKVSKKLETSTIGEKGIGFKTVFSVCDQVHLVSNGFDTYLSSLDMTANREEKKFELTDGTLYSLHLNIEKFDHSIFDKYTLLALKNIRTIIFKDNEKTTSYSLTKGKFNNEYTLTTTTTSVRNKKETSNTTTEVFYCFTTAIDMRNVLCEKRPNFHETTLMIFYPAVWKQDKRFKLHSFLPVKEDYNLPLLIQSDFILSQNREALIDDSDWNIEIINKIPELIVKSFEIMKGINSWRYDFFKLLTVDSKLHFKEIQNKTIDLLKNMDCIPVLVNETQLPRFENPSNVLLLNGSPFNPFIEFEGCMKILQKCCADPLFEKDNSINQIFPIEKLSAAHIKLLAKEVPYAVKLQKSFVVFKLINHYQVDIKEFDFEIIPTGLNKLVKPSNNFLGGNINFSKGALLILERIGFHLVFPSINFYQKNIKKTSLTLEKLSNEEQFVILSEAVEMLQDSRITLCLTMNGKWENSRECCFHSQHTQYLNNVQFVDETSLLTILAKHDSSVSNEHELKQVLQKLGVRSVPALFKINGEETEAFKLLRNLYPTSTLLIDYFDEHIPLFDEKSHQWLTHYFNNTYKLYSPNLKSIFGDAIEYAPKIHNLKLNIRTTADLNAYENLVRKVKNSQSIIKALKSPYCKSIKELLANEPLLLTQDGQFVELDENLFVQLDKRIQKYKPKWKEIATSYKHPEISNLLRTLSNNDLVKVLKENYPSLQDQEYLIETILTQQRYASITPIIVTINGKKRPLSEMYWNIANRDVFPDEIKDRLLAFHFTSPKIKNIVELTNNIKNLPKLDTLLKSHLKKAIAGDISKLKEEEVLQLEALVSTGLPINLPEEGVWELYELTDIPYFQYLDLKRKFGNQANLLKRHDNFSSRQVAIHTIREFLKKPMTDEQFIKVYQYSKRTTYHQKLLSFICDNAVIVHGNVKHNSSKLFKTISNELLEHFPHLKSFHVIGDKYDDFQISYQVPISILFQEVEKLDRDNSEDANEKCLILYKEIDTRIKEGENVKKFKNLKIYRTDKGKHSSKTVYFCDNEDSYKQLSSLVDCLFVRDATKFPHFLQAFDILPLSQRVTYKNLKYELSTTTNNFDCLLEKTSSMIQIINDYLAYNKFEIQPINLCIVRNMSLKAVIDGSSCTYSPDIHSDTGEGVLYINENVFVQSIFKEMKFILAVLQFYPQINGPLKDCLKLFIILSGTNEDMKQIAPLILPSSGN